MPKPKCKNNCDSCKLKECLHSCLTCGIKQWECSEWQETFDNAICDNCMCVNIIVCHLMGGHRNSCLKKYRTEDNWRMLCNMGAIKEISTEGFETQSFDQCKYWRSK